MGGGHAGAMVHRVDKFNKLAVEFPVIKKKPEEALICDEHDIYLFDKLAKDLFGLNDLSTQISNIKKLLAKHK